jgi:protein involved in polysaccharide export with SLBB domain
MLRIRNLVLLSLAICALQLFCTPVHAQQGSRSATRDEVPAYRESQSSELENENLKHAAASAAQIEEVLRKDAGLLVEVKRWAAKEAADSGQVVEDSDLSDQAIFDRLARDVQFRSIITRLLQRYGYLIPAPNPDSEFAKEQDLILKERARRLVQVEAKEDSESLDRTRTESGLERTASCDPRVDEDCRVQPRQVLRRRSLTPDEASPVPTNPPAQPDQLQQPRVMRTMQTASVPQGTELPDGETTRPAGLELLSGSLKRAPESAFDGMSTAGVSSSIQGGPLSVPSSTARETSGTASPVSRSDPSRLARPRMQGGQFDEEQFAPTAMVRRPNPYADVPSLYDMYVQAATHERPPVRFGLEVFQNGTREPDAIPMDLPVGPDYVVGPGDGLAIDLWGSVSQRLTRVVDRQGRVSLPETGPLLVSGRTLGEVQQAVQKTLSTQFQDISADVSLSRLRTVRVYVVGDVAEPGAYDISSLSTPLNALFAAGGAAPRGSLRTLKHFRGKQLVEEVDAYDLLLHGVRSDLKHLENGDTLMVPPIGSQVTVDGMVRRPAIYELRDEKSLTDVLDLAGGILPTAALGHIEVQRIEAHQKRTMFSLNVSPTSSAESISNQLSAFEVRDGDEVRIFPIAPYNEDAIYLQGHVLRPGRYSYRKDMKLSDLVASYNDLLPEPAPRYAEIIRLNLPDHHPSVESFDLSAAMTNPAAAPKLQPLDTVRIFSRYDFETAPTVWVGGEVRSSGRYRTSGQAHVRDAVYLAGGVTPDASLETAQLFRTQSDGTLTILSVNLREALGGNPVDNVLLQPRDRILIQRSSAKVDPPTVYIRGEVAKPGRYPLTANMHASDLVRSANGFLRSADPESADLLHYVTSDKSPRSKTSAGHVALNLSAALAGAPENDPLLRDGDVLTVPQQAGWKDIGAVVTVRGEVRNPGVYGIQPGERLSSLLKRVGGLLPTAYPQAAIFERVEVRELQAKSRQELIQRLEQETTTVKTSVTTTGAEEAALQQSAMQQRQRMLDALRRAPISGRLVIHLRTDKRDFAGSPDDIELRAGDSLEVPKQPGFVLVVGQVYNTNALTYQPGKNAGWYLSRAGGPTHLADKKAIFIIHANGSVMGGGQGGFWTGNVLLDGIGPGDTVVVPEKPIGGSTTWKNVVSIAQVAQAAALVAAVAIP